MSRPWAVDVAWGLFANSGWTGYVVSMSTTDDRFEQTVAACARFAAEHGRLPTRHTPNAEDRSLGLFLQRIRQAERGTTKDIILTTDRLALLDELLPGWRGRGARRDVDEQIREIAAFVKGHKQYPHNRAVIDEAEPRLYRILNHLRRAADGKGNVRLTPERRALLDSLLPDWNRKTDD